MDVTLKEPANIAASGPSGHTAWQNIYVLASTGLHCCGAEDSAVLVMLLIVAYWTNKGLEVAMAATHLHT